MNGTYKTMDQLKDSQLLYDKDPPAFSYFLIAGSVLLLAAAVLWSLVTPKSYVVKSSGTVVSEGKNYIMSAFGGEVTEALVSEGDYVTEGDTLFRIASTEYDLQAKQLSGMIEVDRKKIEQYQRLEECIKTGENLFDENNDDDKPYYYQYETYLSQVAQKGVDISSYVDYNYTSDQIRNLVVRNEDAIAEIYFSTLKSINDSIFSLESEVNNYEVQLEVVEQGRGLYAVNASTSGIVHMDTEYKEGMVVQASSAIGSIVTENEEYSVSVYTDANSRPLIHVGDSVDVAISGLAQTVYGTIPGTVTYIASDITTGSDENKTSVFLVKISLDANYLVSNKGDKINVTNGMPVEARITYDKISYFNYVLESLGVLVR